MWLPLWLALTWMLGTFGAFWLTGLASRVENPGQLCTFIFAATGLFALGYRTRIRGRAGAAFTAPPPPTDQLRRVRNLIFWAASYDVVFGLIQLDEYGATRPQSILESLQNPALGYANKLQMYHIYEDSGQNNVFIVAMILFGALGAALAPLLVVFWHAISWGLRAFAIAGIGTVGAFYLFIGTQKGIGDAAIMLGAGLIIVYARPRDRVSRTGRRLHPGRPKGIRKRHLTIGIATLIVAVFVLYMVYVQKSRASEFGETPITQVSPVMEATFGHETAVGIANSVLYPTHGYLGLAYNLQTPFEWSMGMGSAPTVTSYAVHLFGVDPSQYPQPYPVRTEDLTGWPALMYWATIYPWLASDLTFPGAALFMAVFGWLLAHMWLEAVYSRRILPIVIFGQLCIEIAYIPANNQLAVSSASTIGLATLLVMYTGSGLVRRPRRARSLTNSRNASISSA
jgi:hypothetical protein